MIRPLRIGVRAVVRVHAFTLIELLAGVTVFIIVVAAVMACAATGMRVYHEARLHNSVEVRLLIALERLESQLRSVELFSAIPFQGGADFVSFAGYDAAAGAGPVRVSYRFAGADGGGFSVDAVPFALATADDAVEATQRARRLAENVTGEFAFYTYDTETDKFFWADAWNDEKALPLAVKLALKSGEDADAVTVERIVLIPVALPMIEMATP